MSTQYLQRAFFQILCAVFLSACAQGGQAQAGEPKAATVNLPLAATSVQAPGQSPDKTVHDFYAWYLGQLAKDQDPITLKAKQLRDFVSPALLAEIDKKMQGPDGMESDYFIKSQDYLDSWIDHVTVAPAKVAGPTATVLTTLGPPSAPKSELLKLRITLDRQGNTWKIRRVSKD